MNEALAYFLTWTTYGTWLPGDDRGWHDKQNPSYFPQTGDFPRYAYAVDRLAEPPFTLEPEARLVVHRAIEEACQFKNWPVHSSSVQSNHVHVVLTARDVPPEKVENTLKGRATYRLKLFYPSLNRQRWWTTGGDRSPLYDEAALLRAINYVQEQDISWMKHPPKGGSRQTGPRPSRGHNDDWLPDTIWYYSQIRMTHLGHGPGLTPRAAMATRADASGCNGNPG